MNRCPHCLSHNISKDGLYFRKNDSRYIQRYKCKSCYKKFSKATTQLECGHKKRRVNHQVFKLYSSGMSMRRIAWLLNIHQITVKRKILYLAKKCRLEHAEFLKSYGQVTHLQIDDLITIEHTKLKPLSVSSAICGDTRIILGCQVSQIPAFGHLAKISRKKYGHRESHHIEGLHTLFEKVKRNIHHYAIIKSDEHRSYPLIIQKYLPDAIHQRYPSERGCVTGQGELKRKTHDPLFSINHTYAMLRANMNRLFRRTWCTTKLPEMLQAHLDIYLHCHNQKILGII